tara:strand:- start:39667 stop:39882 length:216 start_codon:yes stop_codon:yes gene_type:complete
MTIKLTDNTRAAARAIKLLILDLEDEWKAKFSYMRMVDPKAASVEEWQAERLEVQQQIAGLREILSTTVEK